MATLPKLLLHLACCWSVSSSEEKSKISLQWTNNDVNRENLIMLRLVLAACLAVAGVGHDMPGGGGGGGHPSPNPLSVDDLDAITLSWNQVCLCLHTAIEVNLNIRKRRGMSIKIMCAWDRLKFVNLFWGESKKLCYELSK
jgi:hypothetical protein